MVDLLRKVVRSMENCGYIGFELGSQGHKQKPAGPQVAAQPVAKVSVGLGAAAAGDAHVVD